MTNMSKKPVELNYKQAKEGDYLIPDIILPENDKPVNKYGRMRKRYLEEHRPILFNKLLLTAKLNDHLSEISLTAEERMERLMEELTVKFPPPDKAQDQMRWVGHMNSLHHQVEEIILAELVYG